MHRLAQEHSCMSVNTPTQNVLSPDDDMPLTPPSPGKTRKQHSSPESWSNEDLSSEAVNASDGKKLPSEQMDDQGRTYSYMSPISSDVEDISEKPRRREYSKKLAKRHSTKRSHQEKSQIRGSTKKIKQCSDISPAESDSDFEVASQNKRSQETKAKMSPKDQESGNCITGKAWVRKQQNSKQSNSHVSTDSDSETSVKLIKTAPMSRKTKEKCIMFTEKVEQSDCGLFDWDNSRVKSGSMSEDEETKDGAEHQVENSTEKFQRRSNHEYADSASSDDKEDVEERPKKYRVKLPQKRKDQDLKLLLRKSEVLEKPTEGSPSKPRVKNKEGQSPRKAVPIECEICGRNIRCKAILERHMLSHTGEKPFECDVCGKHYTSSSNLRIHQLSHSGKMDYTCNLCGQKFTHLPYLKRHLLRHSGRKMHICEHCGKGFIQKYHLLRHILVHTKQMPHVCNKCGMSFNRTDYLKQHLRSVHLIESSTHKTKSEKLFKCETCGKSFASLTTLETHKRVHTAAKPYSCIVCLRHFKQSSHLYSHMFTHSSEKPHACNLCKLKFSRKTYLQKHKEKMHSRAGMSQSS
ncbi:zinc finger protein 239-like [Silurus asotus]|uniref:Zinc finger protein 239-like n=1 Tax=Silurus asotus TaxID=30991 RepID=A0AAD5AXL5_SILAS|nr:zinc finger protein 239-like [Silurus asotus]